MKRNAFVFIFLLAVSQAHADEEATNRPYVAASEWGDVYAKSIPAEIYGTRGETKIYRVRESQDKPVQTFDWYAPEMFVETAGENIYIVQLGPLPRGRRADAEFLAIAFHKNGESMNTYSALDIAKTPDNVATTKSHYNVFGERLGFRREDGRMFFDIKDHKGELLTFDADTGEWIGRA